MTDHNNTTPNKPLITRVEWSDDGNSPLAGIVLTFGYKEGTDPFHFALRAAYPEYETVKERKCMAAIDYLRAELSNPHSKTRKTSSDRGNGQSPAFFIPTEESSRQASLSTSTSPAAFPSGPASPKDGSQRKHSSVPKPGSTHGVRELVFNVVDLEAVPQKKKRKMTQDERIDYKETRKRGACKRCQQQKSKCTHPPDTDNQDGNKSSDHVQPSTIRKRPRTPEDIDRPACLENANGPAHLDPATEQPLLGSQGFEGPFNNPAIRSPSIIHSRRFSNYSGTNDQNAGGYVNVNSQSMAPDNWYSSVPNVGPVQNFGPVPDVALTYDTSFNALGTNPGETGNYTHYQASHNSHGHEQTHQFSPEYLSFDPSWTNNDHNRP